MSDHEQVEIDPFVPHTRPAREDAADPLDGGPGLRPGACPVGLAHDGQDLRPPARLLVPADMWGEVSPRIGAALAPALARLLRDLPVDRAPVFTGAETTPEHRRATFAVVRSGQAARTDSADPIVAEVARRIFMLLTGGAVMALPAVPGPAVTLLPRPALADGHPAEPTHRAAAERLTSLDGLLGAPALNVPVTLLGDLPIGLSLVAAPGRDEILLDLAGALS